MRIWDIWEQIELSNYLGSVSVGLLCEKTSPIMSQKCAGAGVPSAHARKSAETGKQQYNKRVRHTALHEGDRVLVRNMTERSGPGKLRPYWEQQIYVTTRKRKDMPVCEVKPENGDGRSRVLHRNLLLPFSYLLKVKLKK